MSKICCYSKAINEKFGKFDYVIIKCFAKKNTRSKSKRKHNDPLEKY